MFASRRKRSLVGLDITTSSVKLIELTESGGQYRVESYAAEPTPPNAINEKAIVDAEAVGEAIRRARQARGRKTREDARSPSAATRRSPRSSRCRAALSATDLEAQVELQADQYIPFPMDEVSYDFEVIGAIGEGSRDARRAARGHAHRERRAAPGRRARPRASPPSIVDVEAFALENACKLMTHQMPDGGIDRIVAVVDFGASSTTFSVLRNLKVVYTRDFAFGGQQLTEEIMRTYGLTMEEAGSRQEGRRAAGQLSRPKCSIRSSTT